MNKKGRPLFTQFQQNTSFWLARLPLCITLSVSLKVKKYGHLEKKRPQPSICRQRQNPQMCSRPLLHDLAIVLSQKPWRNPLSCLAFVVCVSNLMQTSSTRPCRLRVIALVALTSPRRANGTAGPICFLNSVFRSHFCAVNCFFNHLFFQTLPGFGDSCATRFCDAQTGFCVPVSCHSALLSHLTSWCLLWAAASDKRFNAVWFGCWLVTATGANVCDSLR